MRTVVYKVPLESRCGEQQTVMLPGRTGRVGRVVSVGWQDYPIPAIMVWVAVDAHDVEEAWRFRLVYTGEEFASQPNELPIGTVQLHGSQAEIFDGGTAREIVVHVFAEPPQRGDD